MKNIFYLYFYNCDVEILIAQVFMFGVYALYRACNEPCYEPIWAF